MKLEKEKQYIFVCTAKDCQKRGATSLYKSLKASVKAKGLKKHVELIKTQCMDECKKGPNVICHNRFYANASVEEIEALLNK